ncbi:MAG: hypothetical protein HIU90_15685, partial [Proteobacteria bacterium]|nr:hypothetical protein [Pseudomonadota bacterium]
MSASTRRPIIRRRSCGPSCVAAQSPNAPPRNADVRSWAPRRAAGIFPELSVAETLTATALPRIARFGFVSNRKQAVMGAKDVITLPLLVAFSRKPIRLDGTIARVVIGHVVLITACAGGRYRPRDGGDGRRLSGADDGA